MSFARLLSWSTRSACTGTILIYYIKYGYTLTLIVTRGPKSVSNGDFVFFFVTIRKNRENFYKMRVNEKNKNNNNSIQSVDEWPVQKIVPVCLHAGTTHESAQWTAEETKSRFGQADTRTSGFVFYIFGETICYWIRWTICLFIYIV